MKYDGWWWRWAWTWGLHDCVILIRRPLALNPDGQWTLISEVACYGDNRLSGTLVVLEVVSELSLTA